MISSRWQSSVRRYLPDHGATGNGHGLIYKRNPDATLQPSLRKLEAYADSAERT